MKVEESRNCKVDGQTHFSQSLAHIATFYKDAIKIMLSKNTAIVVE